MPSFMYPRTISVRRPRANAAMPGIPTGLPVAGLADYGGVLPEQETVILTGLPASIQQKATAGGQGAALPSGARANTTWRVFIPLRALPNRDAVETRDIVVDDQGRRFQVTAAYWNSLGYNLLTELLEI